MALLLEVFTVFDEKAKAFLAPFTARSAPEAVRMFTDTAMDPVSMIAKHPSDFTLFRIGSFDVGNGRLEAWDPEALCNGLVARSAAADR